MSAPHQALLMIGGISGDIIFNTFSGSWTLSDANHQAQYAGGSVVNAMSTTGASSGKRYFEIKWAIITNTYTSTVRHDCGLTLNATPATGGSDARGGLGYNRAGAIFKANVQSTSGPALAQGDVVRFAFDLTNHNIWMAVNAGAWVGGGDPTTGTTPTIATTATGTWYPTCSYESAGVNFNAYNLAGIVSRCTYTLPTGFVYWGS